MPTRGRLRRSGTMIVDVSSMLLIVLIEYSCLSSRDVLGDQLVSDLDQIRSSYPSSPTFDKELLRGQNRTIAYCIIQTPSEHPTLQVSIGIVSVKSMNTMPHN